MKPGDILTAVARARRTASLYGPDHPVLMETLAEAHAVIRDLVTSRGSLRISIHEDTFFLDKTVLLEESLQLYSLLVDLREREIGTLEFQGRLEPGELARFVEVLNHSPADLQAAGGIGAALQRANVSHITIGPIVPRLGGRLGLQVDPRDAYRASLRVMDDLNYQASRSQPLELRKARLVVGSIIDTISSDKTALLGVTALKNHDEETCHHSVNVSILSLLMGFQLALDRTVLTTLGLAALLHDVGKVRIPREILNKAGKLTIDEERIMRRHTLDGAHLLRNQPGLARLAMVVAFEHHANFDLSGYPQIAAKRTPHLLTRIVQIADFFDAATSSGRSYRRPMLSTHAMKFIMDKQGKLFDPLLAKLFVHVLGLYPVGSVVELDSGEIGVVMRRGEREVSRPVLKILRSPVGDSVEPHALILEEHLERHIVRALDPLEARIDLAAAMAA